MCCGLRQEILDPETALALDQDDAGTLSKTGSIGGVTTGKPFWDEEKLKAIFDRIFNQAGFKVMGDFKSRSDIEVLAVYSNMLEGGQSVSDPGHFISNALLHSAGLPFCFRTWKGVNGGIVDGGICDNFPWEVLGAADTTDHGPIVGIVFDRTRPMPPKNCLSFSGALLDLAIDNTMERAKQRLGADYLFSIAPKVRTFDFPEALDPKQGLGDAYEYVKEKAHTFFKNLAHDKKTNRASHGVWDENLTIMHRLAEIYNCQHKGNRFHYDLCELEVIAYGLRDGEADVVKYSAKFKTDKEPIYCHAIAVSEAKHKIQIDETTWWMFDENDHPIRCFYLPMQDETTGPWRELLIFFDPILQPNRGPFTLSIRDDVEGLMKQLQQAGRDDLVFTPQRAVGPIRQINLVLHYPDEREVAFLQVAGGQPGTPIVGLELAEYKKRAPAGFKTIGWKGTNLHPTQDFAVDLKLLR